MSTASDKAKAEAKAILAKAEAEAKAKALAQFGKGITEDMKTSLSEALGLAEAEALKAEAEAKAEAKEAEAEALASINHQDFVNCETERLEESVDAKANTLKNAKNALAELIAQAKAEGLTISEPSEAFQALESKKKKAVKMVAKLQGLDFLALKANFKADQITFVKKGKGFEATIQDDMF